MLSLALLAWPVPPSCNCARQRIYSSLCRVGKGLACRHPFNAGAYNRAKPYAPIAGKFHNCEMPVELRVGDALKRIEELSIARRAVFMPNAALTHRFPGYIDKTSQIKA